MNESSKCSVVEWQLSDKEKLIMTQSIMDINQTTDNDIPEIPRNIINKKISSNAFSIDSLLSSSDESPTRKNQNHENHETPSQNYQGSEFNLQYLMHPTMNQHQQSSIDYHQRLQYNSYMDLFRHSRLFYPPLELNGKFQIQSKNNFQFN